MVKEVIHQSWGSRLMDSLKNVVFGVVVFGLGVWLLWWNEQRAVRDLHALNDVRSSVVSVVSTTISPSNEGKLVHVTGEAVTRDVLRDPFFEVEARAIRLRRKVEMYQWTETKTSTPRKNAGGNTGEIPEYSYEKIWAERVIDSGNFQEPGHENPGVMRPEGWSDVAETVTLDSFTLGVDAVQRLRGYEPYTVHRATLPDGARLENSVILYGAADAVPEIGDRRVTFEVVPQGPVSVIAAQKGSRLVPWQRGREKAFIRVRSGGHSVDEMLDQAESEIRLMTWLLRAGGWLLMSFGLITVLTPFAVLGDVIPLLGNLVGGGIRLFSLILCAVLALLIMGVAWLAARPLTGILLMAGALALTLLLGIRARKNRAEMKSAESSRAS